MQCLCSGFSSCIKNETVQASRGRLFTEKRTRISMAALLSSCPICQKEEYSNSQGILGQEENIVHRQSCQNSTYNTNHSLTSMSFLFPHGVLFTKTFNCITWGISLLLYFWVLLLLFTTFGKTDSQLKITTGCIMWFS